MRNLVRKVLAMPAPVSGSSRLVAGPGHLVLHDVSVFAGASPLLFGISLNGIFLGIIGEYIGAIHSRVFQKWLVIEKERINFD